MDWLCLQSDLDNKTWSEIQQRLMEVQQELQMCIHKNELSHLGMIGDSTDKSIISYYS